MATQSESETEQPLNWPDTKSIVFELESLFSQKDDQDDIKEIFRLKKDLENRSREKISVAKQIIQKMSKDIEQKELELMRPEEDAHRAQVSSVTQDQDQVRLKISKKKARLEQLRGQIAQMEREQEELTEMERQNAAKHMEEIPRLKHEISLYAHVTHLKWDYNSDKLSGVIAAPDSEEVRHFEFDPSQMSKFEIANRIWDAIDPPS
mmetsp:Transcript_11866/g.15524  ORF Transcript_11866/g.15524 Transcript_11866/m.15524 type:complete len:207 (-) Transcript_11866:158-778(-)